jgi:hypothetical protein
VLVVDVLLEECAVRRFLVDVAFGDVDVLFSQKTSGVLAGRSSRLGVKKRLCHDHYFTGCGGVGASSPLSA